MINKVSSTIQVGSYLHCLTNCTVSPICDSYNYRPSDKTCQFNTHDTPLIAKSTDIVVDNKWRWYSTTFTIVAWMTPDNWQHVCTEWFFLYCTYSLTKHCTLCLEKGSHLIFDNKNVDWFLIILSPTGCLFLFIALNFTKYHEFVGCLNLLQKNEKSWKNCRTFSSWLKTKTKTIFSDLGFEDYITGEISPC